MKYLSIDTETSGLDDTKHQLLSFAAIIEDTEKKLPLDQIPRFKCIVKCHEITGGVFALNLNQKLIELLNTYQNSSLDDKMKIEKETGYLFLEKDELVPEFYFFLVENGFSKVEPDFYHDGKIMKRKVDGSTKSITITVAGKNFGTFDKLFLEKLPWWKKLIHVRQRIVDPAILYVDWNSDDALPSLKECKERADIKGIVTHDAFDDAWDIILLLRKFY